MIALGCLSRQLQFASGPEQWEDCSDPARGFGEERQVDAEPEVAFHSICVEGDGSLTCLNCGRVELSLFISGLSLLFGRAVLIPLLGLEGFGVYAAIAIALHNYLGPFFLVGVLLGIVSWIKYMLPEKSDWAWLKLGGGFFGHGAHPHAGRINAGEKLLTFWLGLVVLGIAVCVTGIIMDFPGLGQSRETMQISNLIHGVASIVWMAMMLGHMYLGSVAMEGTLVGMTQGRVSVEWAKQHHDLWYDEQRR